MAQISSGLRREVSTLGAAGIALLLLFLGVMTNRYRFEGLPLRPHTEHFALGVAFLVLAFLFFTKRIRFRLQWSDALLALYLGLALLASVLYPADRLDSVQYWARMITAAAVYFLRAG